MRRIDPDTLYSAREVEELLGVSKNTVLRLLTSGELRGARVGPKLWRIKGSDVLTYYERQAEQPKVGEKVSVRFTEGSLAKVGVELINPHTGWLACKGCGQRWSPNIQPGGRNPKGWWQCPNGCNKSE